MDAVKAVVGGKGAAINTYVLKEERSRINKPNLTPQRIRKIRTKPRVGRRRKEIIKIRAQISQIDNREINKTMSSFFEKNKIN